jgi:hypothetical protein
MDKVKAQFVQCELDCFGTGQSQFADFCEHGDFYTG